MKMKAKYTLLIIALGFCLDFTAGLLKIMHSREANTLFVMATFLKVVGVLWFVFKLVRYEGFKKFMER